MTVKKYLPVVTFWIVVSVVLSGCLGALEKRAERAEEGAAKARFDTYSALVVAEEGISVIEIENTLSEDVSVKITALEAEDIWMSCEIPAQDALRLELGATDYLLEVWTENGSRDELLVHPGDTTIQITNEWFDVGF